MKRIKIERDGAKIHLRGWVGSDTPGLCKSVPGGRFNPDGKFWAYPLDMSTCRALRAAFGEELNIGPELLAWATDAAKAEAKLTALASSMSAELVNVPRFAPRIAEAMQARTYQQVGAAFGARVGSFGLFDEPRIGKTIQTLGALVEANGERVGRHLVLCPLIAVKTVWETEVGQWLDGTRAKAWPVTGTRAQRQEVFDDFDVVTGSGINRDHFLIANAEMARIVPKIDSEGKPKFIVKPGTQLVEITKRGTKTYARGINSAEEAAPGARVETRSYGADWPELFSVQWDTVIVDESHRALIKAKKPTQIRQGMVELAKIGKKRIALSGTPMRGKPEQLWGTLNWLRPDLFTSYWKWVECYWKLTSNGFSNYVLDNSNWLPGGEDRLAQDLRPHSLRRTRAEVKPELPPKEYAGTNLIPSDPMSPRAVWLTMDTKQANAYKSFSFDSALEVEGGEIVADGILAQYTRQKQLAGSTLKIKEGRVTPTLPSVKFDWLVQFIDELGVTEGQGTDQLVVASQFTSLLNCFARELRELGVAVHLLTGETPDKTRQAQVDDFQSDSPTARVFLLNTKAAGVAIPLHAADDLVLLDETYNPDDQEQVEDRIVSMDKDRPIRIHALKVLDTIEEEIAWITAASGDVMRYLLDGSRGVDVARKLYEAKAAA